MKYQSSITKLIHEFVFEDRNGKRYKCPECSNDSKRKNPKDLQYYPETKLAYCHKCQTTYFEYKIHNREKQYKIPEWKNITKLSDKAVNWFTGRMISQKTLNKMKIYSDFEYMPQHEKKVEVICFPFFCDNKQINIKYRGPQKSFKMFSGAELIFYNIDALKNNREIIICEGEIDALTWIELGFDNVISVPNGASAKNMEYLDNSIELFENIEKIYLSTDNDTPGIILRDELIRRLGANKCHILNLRHFKDCNDYFIGIGGNELKTALLESKQVPIKGIIKIPDILTDILDLYENGIQPGLPILNNDIDNIITWELGRLVIITGIPGSGKSEFADYIITRLNHIYSWKVAYFTPENYPLKFHYRKIHEKYSGKQFDKKKDNTDFYSIYEHIKDNYFYILDEDDMTVDTVMESALNLVKQKGIKILVIDPYNKLEHSQDKYMSETQYISKFIDKIINFARFNNILVFLIAHPRKMPKDEIPNLYDIAGSANFFNKTDYGITIHRPRNEEGNMTNDVEIYVQKIKFRHLGQTGSIQMKFNYNNGRYETYLSDVNSWDNSNWLNKSIENTHDHELTSNFDFYNEGEEMPF